MILLADMGNTNVVLAGYEGGVPHFVARLATRPGMSGAWWQAAFEGAARQAGCGQVRFEGAALWSVVPPLNQPVKEGLAGLCGGREPVFLSRRGDTAGVDIYTDDPDEVGNDILAGAIAVKVSRPLPALVVDLGTATTFTPQDRQGNILGVSIAPGVRLGLEALAGHASQLCQVAMQAPRKAVGKNTVDSLKSGVILGAAALLDGLADRIEAETGSPFRTLAATGGLAGVVEPHCRRRFEVAPNLVLDGLWEYYRRNRAF